MAINNHLSTHTYIHISHQLYTVIKGAHVVTLHLVEQINPPPPKASTKHKIIPRRQYLALSYRLPRTPVVKCIKATTLALSNVDQPLSDCVFDGFSPVLHQTKHHPGPQGWPAQLTS